MREARTSANTVRSTVVVLLFLLMTGCQYTTEYQDARKGAYGNAYREAYDSAYRAAWNDAYERGRDKSYAVTLNERLHSGQYHYRFSYWMLLWLLGALVGWLLQYWLAVLLAGFSVRAPRDISQTGPASDDERYQPFMEYLQQKRPEIKAYKVYCHEYNGQTGFTARLLNDQHGYNISVACTTRRSGLPAEITSWFAVPRKRSASKRSTSWRSRRKAAVVSYCC